MLLSLNQVGVLGLVLWPRLYNILEEEDAFSEAFSEESPTTTLFVPGQDYNQLSSTYCQPCEMEPHSTSHRFVVCADTQFGITKNNETWQAEMDYSVAAVDKINSMDPKPAFVCVCGDLVDMEFSFEKKKGSKSKL